MHLLRVPDYGAHLVASGGVSRQLPVVEYFKF